MNEQAHSLGASTTASFAMAWAGIVGALPRILGFLLILVIGWFVATLIAKGVAALLRAVHFNDVAERSGFSGFVRKMGVHHDASGFLAIVAKWFIRLIVLVVAFDALGLPAVSGVLRQMLLWLPNVVVAMVVLVIAGLAAKALAGLVRGATAEAGFSNPDLLATVASTAVWAFAIVVAVNQLGIATALVNTLLTGVVGALALAFGLAFGLGGRDTANELLQDWRQRTRENAPKLQAAAQHVQQQAATTRPSRPARQQSSASPWSDTQPTADYTPSATTPYRKAPPPQPPSPRTGA